MRANARKSTLSLCVFALIAAACSSSSSTPVIATHALLGPQFIGAGTSGAGQSIAAGLNALGCADPVAFSFTQGPAAGARSHLSCFYDRSDHVAASIEWIVESAVDSQLVHVRLVLNPDFCDNTYGANAIGWTNRGPGAMGPAAVGPGAMGPAGKGPAMGPAAMGPGAMGPAMAAHTFKDLVESDHAEFKLSDARGALVLHFKQDYLTALASAPSGYTTLGVSGGDGAMLQGSARDIVAVSTSLDRNLNACGLDDYFVDSPPTDANYTPVRGAEAWDYRVVYDVWVNAAAFGSVGFGDAVVDFVHASPSKAAMPTWTVTKHACPPEWKHYCDDPDGCGDQRVCGDVPDAYCTDASVPEGPADSGPGLSPI